VDARSNLLDAGSLLEDAALDRYEFIRDGYLQRRENQIHPDGDGPRPQPKSDDGDAKPAAPEAAPAAGAVKTSSVETSATVSSESAPKELNSGTPAANNASL
jgi:phospholipid-binding lipoprotein MlaA